MTFYLPLAVVQKQAKKERVRDEKVTLKELEPANQTYDGRNRSKCLPVPVSWSCDMVRSPVAVVCASGDPHFQTLSPCVYNVHMYMN